MSVIGHGTEIVTSTTRPSSPSRGSNVFETDTNRSWTYNGTVWVPDDMVFANEAARDAVITSPTTGMEAYLTSPTTITTQLTGIVPTTVKTVYSGGVWVVTTPITSTCTTADGYHTNASWQNVIWNNTYSGYPAPYVKMTTGASVLVSYSANIGNNSAAGAADVTLCCEAANVGSQSGTRISYDGTYSRAYSTAASEYNCASRSYLATGFTPGLNTFTLVFRRVGGSTANVNNATITVQGVV